MVNKIYKVVCCYSGINPEYWEKTHVFNISKETDKSYICAEDGRRFKKEDFGRINSSSNITTNFIIYRLYCLEENVEETKEKLRQHIIETIKKMKTQIDTAYEIMGIKS